MKTVTMKVGGEEYALDFEDNIMTLTAGDRKLIFRQKHEADEAATQETEYQTLGYGDISVALSKVCPTSEDHWTDRAVS